MPKQQKTQIKKALSAPTPKALNIIPLQFRNEIMRNSNALATNNQIRSEQERQQAALLIICKAGILSQSTNYKAWAIKSIGKTINQNIVDNTPIDSNVIGGLLHAVEVLTEHLIDESSALKALINEGEYSDE